MVVLGVVLGFAALTPTYISPCRFGEETNHERPALSRSEFDVYGNLHRTPADVLVLGFASLTPTYISNIGGVGMGAKALGRWVFV
ncbi:MAG: hypothetical protein WHS86_04145 [Desulfosoma sp.]